MKDIMLAFVSWLIVVQWRIPIIFAIITIAMSTSLTYWYKAFCVWLGSDILRGFLAIDLIDFNIHPSSHLDE